MLNNELIFIFHFQSVLLKKKLEEHLEKLHEANNELQKKRAIIEDLEPRFNNSSLRIEELQEALRKKEEEMKQMEERYKKYLEKAKSVIRTLDPKQNQGAAPEIQALKNQLQERDRLFHSLEKEYEKTKSQRDMEEKYIVSAWYNMKLVSVCLRIPACPEVKKDGVVVCMCLGWLSIGRNKE